MTADNLSIDRLDEVVASLPAPERELVERIYAISVVNGELRIPPSMQPWIQQQFGSVEAVSRQKIVRVTNKVTGEESLFSRLRALRPIECKVEKKPAVIIGDDVKLDLFDDPYHNTPEDTFGRVVGKHCVTASNVAKFDALHGILISNNHDPLAFSREAVIDYMDTAREWARKAREVKPEAKYFLFFWNCQWRAGASIHHGHTQVTLTSGRHYGKIEQLRQFALGYRQSYGSNYFHDMFRAHHALGCAVEREGVRILSYLTPYKNNEVVIMADETTRPLKGIIYDVLALFRDRLEIEAFNLGLVTPPLAETEESWDGFPVMARLVDRGNPADHTSDIGSMEIYAASVVCCDPLWLARELREYLAVGRNDG